jgi:lysophospholipase L1-like esterase
MYLSYKPFVMYGPDWDEEFSKKELAQDSNSCRLLLVGGSTAQGFPAALLEKELNKTFTPKTFQVLNVGTGGYESRQEVIVAFLWGPKVHPHVIVSLDGANDLAHRLRVQKAGAFYLNDAYELFLTRPFFAPLYYILGQSQFYNGMVRFWQKRNILDAEFYEDAIPIYIEAQHSLNILAKGLGANRLMILQPFSAFKDPLSNAEAAFDLYKYREAQVKRLYEATHDKLRELADKDDVPYLDGRSIYNGMSDTIFTDDVHLTDLGYQVLAQRITAMLQSEMANDLTCGVRIDK